MAGSASVRDTLAIVKAPRITPFTCNILFTLAFAILPVPEEAAGAHKRMFLTRYAITLLSQPVEPYFAVSLLTVTSANVLVPNKGCIALSILLLTVALAAV